MHQIAGNEPHVWFEFGAHIYRTYFTDKKLQKRHSHESDSDFERGTRSAESHGFDERKRFAVCCVRVERRPVKEIKTHHAER